MDCVFTTSIFGPDGKHEDHELRWKKQDAVTYRTDRENAVCKLFIISLGSWIELESTPQSQAVCSLDYGPPSMDAFTALSVVDRRNSQKSRKSYLNSIRLSEMLQLTRVIEISRRARLWPNLNLFFSFFSVVENEVGEYRVQSRIISSSVLPAPGKLDEPVVIEFSGIEVLCLWSCFGV